MGNITKPYGDFTNNVDVADATKVNAQINLLYNTINGGIDQTNAPTLGYTVTAISANTTLTNSQVGIIECTAGASGITVTLPSAATAGLRYIIKHIDSGVGIVTINTTSSQTIDGVAARTLVNQYAEIIVVSNGSNWDVITENIIDFPTFTMSRQALINGNLDVWQRGTSFTNPAAGTYGADRWQVNYANAGVLPTSLIHSRQSITPGDFPGTSNYYRINTNGAGSGFGVSDSYGMFQKIEYGSRYLCGVGKKITASFYARSDITGKKLGVHLTQAYGTGGSPSASEQLTGQIITLTSSWTKYTITFTPNTLVGKTFGTNNDDSLNLNFNVMFGSTFASARYGSSTSETFGGAGNIDIAQVQVNAGDQALSFQPRSFADEISLCQRYYEKSYDTGTNPGTNTGNGVFSYRTRDSVAASISGGLNFGTVFYRVKKRTVPTVTLYGTTSGVSNAVRVNQTSDRTGVTVAYNGHTGFSSANVDSTSSIAINQDNVIDFHWASDAEL